MTGLLPSRIRHHTKPAAAPIASPASHPPELSSDTWWPFTDNETDPATFNSRALEVHVDVADRRITLGGELDLASIDTLTDVVALLIEHNPGNSTIDLCGLSAVDAAGFDCLVGINRRLIAMGATLSVAGAPPELRLIFDIAGLFGILETGRASAAPR
jgi:anti-anti-sigma factor